MKKLLSFVLSAALLCALAVPVAAAESADARLAAVTEKVKATLGLNTEAYTEFHGELVEGAVIPVWNLQWSGEGVWLNISATEAGKILHYNLSDEVGGQDFYYPRPSMGTSFPKLSRADAQVSAKSFLDKALLKGFETAQFGAEEPGQLSTSSYYFSGKVLENGLPSPFSFHITVRVKDAVVTSFSLGGSPESFLGGLPSPTPATDKAKASESLKSILKLRLEYVLDKDGKTAKLRYLPEAVHEYYVDAQTGKLIDLTELRQDLWNRGVMNDTAEAPSASPTMKAAGLSEVEQAGVAKMEGVRSKEELDAAARKISALKLEKYALSNVSYRLVDKEKGEVSATLQYAYKSADSIYRRTVTLDAKTGTLKSVYSSRPWSEGEKATMTSANAQAKAESFLKEICPDQFGKTALYQPREADGSVVYSFQFAQRANGYFLPASSISVEIDGADGAVSGYYNNFVEGVTFESPEGIIDMNAALTAWFNTYDVTLGYLAVPQKLDLSQPEWKPLIEMGRSYLYTRKLAYYTEREGWYQGVDAKTGEAVKGDDYSGRKGITYDDLANHWVKASAEKLALYGVGWLGGRMEPGKELKQIDLVALLASTGGYLYDSTEEKAADRLYEQAYYMGILKKAERNDSAPVTRAQMAKLLLDSVGYGKIAELKGIFKVGFADGSSIPEEFYGYAAVAQALGIIKGDGAGNFAPGRTATRAEAVSVLFNFMSR